MNSSMPLERDLHGPPDVAGQERGDDVDRVEIEPAAEVAADRRLHHPHPIAGDAEGLGEVALVEERHLGGAPHGERGVGLSGGLQAAIATIVPMQAVVT